MELSVISDLTVTWQAYFLPEYDGSTATPLEGVSPNLVYPKRNKLLPLYFRMGGFYPSLFYNVMMNKVSRRNWFDRVDEHVLVGALPFKSDMEKMVKDENVKGVISLCQDYEHKKFVACKEDWEKAGVDYLNLPTIDYTSPSLDDIETGIEFIQKHADQNETVYVHCKAGRTRSATLAGCYLIHKKKWAPSNSKNYLEARRPHVVLQDLHFRAMYRYYDQRIHPSHKKTGKSGSQEDLTASGEKDAPVEEGEKQPEGGSHEEEQGEEGEKQPEEGEKQPEGGSHEEEHGEEGAKQPEGGSHKEEHGEEGAKQPEGGSHEEVQGEERGEPEGGREVDRDEGPDERGEGQEDKEEK